MKLQELIAERQSFVDELDKILAAADSEKRGLTEDDETKFSELEEKIAAADKSIERQRRLETARANQAQLDEYAATIPGERLHPEGNPLSKGERRDLGKYSFLKLCNAVSSRMQGGDVRLEGLELEMHQEAQRERRQATGKGLSGIGIPQVILNHGFKAPDRRMDMTAGTDAEGGFSVATEVRPLIDILRESLMTRQLGATFLTGLQGDVTFPRGIRAAQPAEKAENAAADELSPTMGQLALSPNRLPAVVDLSKQLLIQSSVDVENWVRGLIGFQIASQIDAQAINGSGTPPAPEGILNASGIGDVGVDAVPAWGDLVDLETAVAVDNAAVGNLAYLTTPGMRGVLKQTERATNTGLWVWGDGNMVNGYRAAVSTNVPSNLGVGTDEHAIIFGNWSELIIAQWGGMDVIVDPYTQAATGILRMVFETFYDVGLRNVQSFAAILDGRLA